MRKISSILFPLLLAVLIAACSQQTAKRQFDDASITASVKAKLAADARLATLTDVEVNTTNGVVTLAGQVTNADESRLIAELTRSVDGVVRVNNNLQVRAPAS